MYHANVVRVNATVIAIDACVRVLAILIVDESASVNVTLIARPCVRRTWRDNDCRACCRLASACVLIDQSRDFACPVILVLCCPNSFSRDATSTYVSYTASFLRSEVSCVCAYIRSLRTWHSRASSGHRDPCGTGRDMHPFCENLTCRSS